MYESYRQNIMLGLLKVKVWIFEGANFDSGVAKDPLAPL